jgi:hypothetical protein
MFQFRVGTSTPPELNSRCTPRYLERMVCQLIPATMQLRDPKTNARCDISGTVTELSNVKWNDKKVKQNVIF